MDDPSGTLMTSIPPPSSVSSHKKKHPPSRRHRKKKRKQNNKEMTPEEQLDLSPWAKWILYRKFPFKLLFHLTLVILSSAHVLTINTIFDSYSRAVTSTWSTLLFPSGYHTPSNLGYELYTIPDVLTHAQHLVSSYYSLPFNSVDTLTIYEDPYRTSPDSLLKVPTLEVVRSKHETGTTPDTNETVFEIEETDKGWPLAQDGGLQEAYETGDVEYTEDFFNNLLSMVFTLPVRSTGISTGPTTGVYTLCVYWDVKVTYDLGARGQIIVGLESYLFLDSPKHKDVLEDGSYRMVLGAATAGLWFSSVQYLEYFPRFYMLIWTLKTGLPRVLQFFVGIFPFFIGYALLGMTLFGDECSLFGDIQSTTCTLFSVVNGDSVLDVFDALKYAFPIGDVYLYVYIMIFMYVVLMSVIAIVEEAFFDSLRGQGLDIGGEHVNGAGLGIRGGGGGGTNQRNDTTTGAGGGGGGVRPKRKTSIFNSDVGAVGGLLTPGGHVYDLGEGVHYTPPVGGGGEGEVEGFNRERVRSKSINISTISQGHGGDGKVGSQGSFGILGSSPATFQSRLMPAKLREVLRSVSRKEGGGEGSSSESDDSGSESDAENEGGGREKEEERDSGLNNSGFKMDDEDEFDKKLDKKGGSSSGRTAGDRMTLGGN
ncbi:hypothetical protein TrCOL_g8078 [Triparma columacea]|uniref:Polycystin cation channel PKD1/PKD2 domain-containing protein n=1 Tax=Triparma columacea TaxID=722753 RepID=A0A9W7G7K5_9STRA|nr:hypothetical protein TrCOL_g8078 [Triparma columacea]